MLFDFSPVIAFIIALSLTWISIIFLPKHHPSLIIKIVGLLQTLVFFNIGCGLIYFAHMITVNEMMYWIEFLLPNVFYVILLFSEFVTGIFNVSV